MRTHWEFCRYAGLAHSACKHTAREMKARSPHKAPVLGAGATGAGGGAGVVATTGAGAGAARSACPAGARRGSGVRRAVGAGRGGVLSPEAATGRVVAPWAVSAGVSPSAAEAAGATVIRSVGAAAAGWAGAAAGVGGAVVAGAAFAVAGGVRSAVGAGVRFSHQTTPMSRAAARMPGAIVRMGDAPRSAAAALACASLRRRRLRRLAARASSSALGFSDTSCLAHFRQNFACGRFSAPHWGQISDMRVVWTFQGCRRSVLGAQRSLPNRFQIMSKCKHRQRRPFDEG